MQSAPEWNPDDLESAALLHEQAEGAALPCTHNHNGLTRPHLINRKGKSCANTADLGRDAQLSWQAMTGWGHFRDDRKQIWQRACMMLVVRHELAAGVSHFKLQYSYTTSRAAGLFIRV